MVYARTSVASGSCPCVRRHFTTGVAVVGAGILAASLVVVPPDASGTRSEVRAPQLASLALPSEIPSPADLERFVEKFVGMQAHVPVAGINGASDITTALVAGPRTFDLAIDPSTGSRQVNGANLGSALGLADGVSIPGLVLAAAFAAFLFGALIPAAFLYGFIGYNIIDPILGLLNGVGAPAATLDETLAPSTFSTGGQPTPVAFSTMNSAELASTAQTPNATSILEPLLPVLGPVILVGAIGFGFLVVLPAEWAIGSAYEAVAGVIPGLPPTLPLPGTIAFNDLVIKIRGLFSAPQVSTTNVRALNGDLQQGDPVSAVMAAGPGDAAPVVQTGKHNEPTVTATDGPTETEQPTSMEFDNEQISTDSDPLAGDPPKPSKPRLGSATHRPLVHSLLKVGERVRDVLHLGNRSASTARNADADDAVKDADNS